MARTAEEKRAYNRAYYAKHREEFRAYARDYRKANPHVTARWKQQTRRERHAAHLLRRFGLTAEMYAGLVAACDNRCAICRQPESQKDRSGNIKPLSVDHCHVSGRIRGLLCDACNNMLGRAKDSPRVLTNALAYLALAEELCQE